MKPCLLLVSLIYVSSHAIAQIGQKQNSPIDSVKLLADKVDSLTKKIAKLKKDSAAVDTTLYRGLMYLNAFSFDFNQTLASNYVGHFALFSPSLNNTRWGFNAGIMKFAYSVTNQQDSIVRYERDYVSINPLKDYVDGDKYLRQFNKYTTKTNSGVYWSLYAQPLYELGSRKKLKSNSNKIFLHLHGELLVSKVTASTSVHTMQRDSSTATLRVPPSLVAPSNYNSSIAAYYGYFGAGLTFYLTPWTKSHFFFQPTVGVKNGSFIGEGLTQWQGFYLLRTYYITKLSNASTLIIGTDIRGNFPTDAPIYAVYVGLNLKLETLISALAN